MERFFKSKECIEVYSIVKNAVLGEKKILLENSLYNYYNFDSYQDRELKNTAGKFITPLESLIGGLKLKILVLHNSSNFLVSLLFVFRI